MALDIRLKRVNKIYSEGDDLSGVVVFESRSEAKHEGIVLSIEGTVNMQLSSKNVGIFEAFYNSVKPVPLISYGVEIARSGKLPVGKTEIPFEMPLRPKTNRCLYETYHGVFITIQYLIKCEVKRPMLNKDLQKVVEFIVEYRKPPELKPLIDKSVHFLITPESLQNVKDRSKIPKFRISGQLESTVCKITEPFTGELCVEQCDAVIRSIELQLVRVETCGCAEGYARDGRLNMYELAKHRKQPKSQTTEETNAVLVSTETANEVKQDPCIKMKCGSGKECIIETETGAAKCQCISACADNTDVRRRVCSNHNTTWQSDCHLFKHRCTCLEELVND
ncbi:unnamed protein product [Oppiella nova]|uniref:Vacuolar protein sorting-associated protein 26C n=1 Tax=Oppiella nova TaxID=334625 RepID=A0A7R9LKD4_9ACAR|nr:unnamed protein product [Oppiella nova]CAG2163840.1 unnamed protein product [Oppiella nova]